jgi:DNA/RNA-binding domain of Phe-tRNA-synthetase-like protein
VTFPPQVQLKLSGWELLWVELEIKDGNTDLAVLREQLPARVKQILKGHPPAEHPTVQSVRSLFRNAGCDPTRHRPSSEALVRRLLKGQGLPAIWPAVDINNIWSVELLVPCCVIHPQRLSGALVLRRGQIGETMPSMRGTFNLEGKPVLADAEGPFGTPITDSERVKVTGAAGTFWLVAYLPKAVVTAAYAHERLTAITADLKGVRATFAEA